MARGFDLSIDSKLRGYYVVKIRIRDLVSAGRVRARATVLQQKTSRPVQFELLEERRGGTLDDYAFPSRHNRAKHLSARQYARMVDERVTGIGLRREDYGTHSLRRTKASIIYKATGKPSGGPDLARPHQDREYGSLPRRRRRRRAHSRRVHRGITAGPAPLFTMRAGLDPTEPSDVRMLDPKSGHSPPEPRMAQRPSPTDRLMCADVITDVCLRASSAN